MPLAKEQNLVQLLIGQLYNHPWKLYVMQEQSQELSTHFVSAYCTTSSMQHFFQIWLFIVCLDCRPKQTNHDHLAYLLLQSCGVPVIVLYII